MWFAAKKTELLKCLRDLKDLGADTITISVDKRCVCFSVDGSIGRGTAVITDGVSRDGEVDVKCAYPFRYLASFAKCAPLSESARLHLGKETPLCVRFDLEGRGHLEFYLASRYEDD